MFIIIELRKDFILKLDKENAFTGLGLSPFLIKNLLVSGIINPKPIQEQTIPVMLEGRDILGIAQTGSGKTLAFTLPILSQILALGNKRYPKTARALILSPTRELAVQIEETIIAAVKGAHLSTCLILGGMSRFAQIKRMKMGVDVLIATPGRLMDLVCEKHVDLSQSCFLVLDEADRMLDMGFINDVKKIATLLHKKRQTALFSATMPKEIVALANGLLNEPVKIEIVAPGTTATAITQKLYCVPTRAKKNFLNKLLADPAFSSIIVFTRTKYSADSVSSYLERAGYSVATIHGNKSQNARQRALRAFRGGSVKILVATDIVARGIDILGISHVINYDLPDEAESYVHRIGRTGRNGASGKAITLFDEKIEWSRLRSVERLIRMKLVREEIPSHLADFSENLLKKLLMAEGEEHQNGKKRCSKEFKRTKQGYGHTNKVAQLNNRNSSTTSARHKKAKEAARRVKLCRLDSR